jgi:hypothetical protein
MLSTMEERYIAVCQYTPNASAVVDVGPSGHGGLPSFEETVCSGRTWRSRELRPHGEPMLAPGGHAGSLRGNHLLGQYLLRGF